MQLRYIDDRRLIFSISWSRSAKHYCTPGNRDPKIIRPWADGTMHPLSQVQLVAEGWQPLVLQLWPHVEHFRYGRRLPFLSAPMDNDGLPLVPPMVTAF
jgi:hypothetical protein